MARAAATRSQKPPRSETQRRVPPPPEETPGLPTFFDAECGTKVLGYESDTPHAVRVRVLNAKDSRCTVTFRLFKKDGAGMLSGPTSDVAPSTEGILERKEISVIEIQCKASGGGVSPCKGRYVIEFLD